MKTNPTSSIYFFYAVAIHLGLLGFLIFHFNLFEKVKPATAFISNVKIVNAVMVDQNKVDHEIKKLKQAELQKRLAEQEKLRKLQEEKNKIAEQKLAEQRQLEALKQQRLLEDEKRLLAAKEEAKKLAELKAKQIQEQKKLKETQAKKKKEEEQLAKLEKEKIAKKKQEETSEKDKLKKEQEKMLENELAQEEELLTSANNRRMMSEIERFTALIAHEVGRHWIVPDGANKNTKCVLLIRLAPGGVVKDVKLVTSSGDVALDRSAQNAVFRASPLPVPESAELFEKFQEIKLVVKPEGFLT